MSHDYIPIINTKYIPNSIINEKYEKHKTIPNCAKSNLDTLNSREQGSTDTDQARLFHSETFGKDKSGTTTGRRLTPPYPPTFIFIFFLLLV